MRKLLTIAIPSVLAAGMVAAALNEPKTQLSANQGGEVTGTTSPAVIEVPATEPTTTTTLAPPPPPPPPETTTTTAAPVTTTTMRAAPPVTAPRPTVAASPRPKPASPPPTAAPAPQPQTQPGVDCGSGTAGATAQAYMNGSTSLLRVIVKNATNKHIEIDKITVYATYNGQVKTFNLPVAGQRVIASEDPINNPTLHTIEIPESASSVSPTTLDPPEFAFHTAGLPECAAQPVG